MAPCAFKSILRQTHKAISVFILVCFISTSINNPAYSQVISDSILHLPAPGFRVGLSPDFAPAILKGITVHPENPFQFDFIVDQGDNYIPLDKKKEAYQKLVKYFLASLTIPEKDLWVNLSPYEKNRIIPNNFGMTEMGREILSQDYLLKQITASLIYPEESFGRKFWNKIYKKAHQQLGTTDIPVNTFNKVWIVPDQATVYENGNTAFVLKSHLKVMLEEDYLALDKHTATSLPLAGRVGEGDQHNKAHAIASQTVREMVLPVLEKEINEDKNFAQLRQINNSLILATWFKKKLKESLLGRIYVDKGKVKGVDQDPKNNQEIYRQYLSAYKKGVYNYIKDDFDTYSQQTIPRKYFSGGWSVDGAPGKKNFAETVEIKSKTDLNPEDLAVLAVDNQDAALLGRDESITVDLKSDFAMKSDQKGSLSNRYSKMNEGLKKVELLPEYEPIRQRTMKALTDYPVGVLTTVMVLGKTEDGKLWFRKTENNGLEVPEIIAQGGQGEFNAARAALPATAEITSPEIIGYMSDPDRAIEDDNPDLLANIPFVDSVLVEGVLTGKTGSGMVAIDVNNLKKVELERIIARVTSEQRAIVRKYLTFGNKIMKEGKTKEAVPRLGSRASEKIQNKRHQAAQKILAQMISKGIAPIAVAPDVMARLFSKNGKYLGILYIRRKQDGHYGTVGGFWDSSIDFGINRTAEREFWEEAGAKVTNLEHLYYASDGENGKHRDDREYVRSKVLKGDVFISDIMAGDDADRVDYFVDRQDFENFLLDKDNWGLDMSIGKLSEADKKLDKLIDALNEERDKNGERGDEYRRISADSYKQLQDLMEERRRSGLYGLLWADHLEHFRRYFDDIERFPLTSSVYEDNRGLSRQSDVVRELKKLTLEMKKEGLSEDDLPLLVEPPVV
ncbi:MAG: NUDIX hydrolase [Candidatus Omnitrophica bacterium]|nr:NUDIX hydrolase [Candidatus Omnitrophota bacterium]